LNSGELEAAEARLRDVERWLESSGTQIMSSHDVRLRSLSAELAAARVYLAQARGNVPDSLEHAKQALDLIPEDDQASRATGTALLALALWGRGDLEAAHRTFGEALAGMRAADHHLDAIRGTFVLGDIRVAQGRLRDARRHYENGLQLASDARTPEAAETDELHLGLSELYREWNDLTSAVRHLDAITQSAKHASHNGNKLRWCTAMARIREASGDLESALDLLDEAAQHERRDPLPRVRPIPALRARIRLAQGKIDDAMDWARRSNVSVDENLGYIREFEHITLARILSARTSNDAQAFLERLHTAARVGGRIGSLIEILILEALLLQSSGNLRAALDCLSQALALAEPEGYLRVFLDEGSRMRDLLKSATARGLAGEYTRRVLAAFEAPRQPVAPTSASSPVGGLVQPLTTREQEILRLIAAGLRNQEIADHLSISAATVKRHIANAYGKLGAGHRTEALARASELKLL